MADEHDLGLPHDLAAVLTRRRALGLIASAAAVATSACDNLPFAGKAEAEVVATGPDGVACVVHPEEVAGPFPADGSNKAHGTLANVLRDSGIVRRDMRANLESAGSPAEGTVLDLTVSLVAVGPSCTPLAGHAVYLWHCDAAGRYSIYDLPDRSYLRAVGVSDEKGRIEFQTIIPGCYLGRYPHMHFEVYPSITSAIDYRQRVLTSQLAIPGDICSEVYGRDPVYQQSRDHFARSPLDRDMIFRDNTPKQLAAQTLAIERLADGSYRGSVTIGIKAAA
ncbi:MAG: hypothetical protein JNM89_00270 [Hyphomicrobiaceae bacterium]|nr:hypothetical protein [Hyphomicrobiaceae bacterium]